MKKSTTGTAAEAVHPTFGKNANKSPYKAQLKVGRKGVPRKA